MTDQLIPSRSVISLVGPPGVGKTRLAVEVAGRMADRQEAVRRVAFCDLRTVQSANELIAALADALDLPIFSQRDLDAAVDFIGETFREAPALIIFDNFEQLIEPGRELIADWFDGEPAATALITTRRPLEIDGEHRIDLAPLQEEEATELYLQRAESTSGLTEAEEIGADTAGRLVEQLDRLPLAIELAAARLPVLGPRELLDRLDRQLEVLQHPNDHPVDGKPALHRAIAQSWSLLAPWEKRALAQLAVFRGAFSVDAAEAVVDLDDFDQAPPVALVVHSLFDHSLLRTDSTVNQRRYFSLYESIRQFVAHQPVDGAERRHAEYFADLADRLQEAFYTEQASRMLDEFAFQSGNIRRAADWAIDSRPVLAARLAEPLVVFLNIRKPYGDDLTILQQTLGALEALEPDPEVERAACRMHLFLGKRWQTHGEREPAERHFLQAREMAAEHDFSSLRVEVLKDLGFFWVFHVELDRAEQALEEGFERAGELEEGEPLEASLNLHAGLLAQRRGQLEDARRHFHRALTMYRRDGNLRYAASTYHNLGRLEIGIGEFERAVDSLQRALELRESFGDIPALAGLSGDLGFAHLGVGDLERASAAFERVLALTETLQHKYFRAEYLSGSALVALERGDSPEAAAKIDRAVSLLEEVGSQSLALLVYSRKALIDFARGELSKGRASLAAAKDHPGNEDPERIELHRRIVEGERELAEARLAVEQEAYGRAKRRLAAAKKTVDFDDDSAIDGQPYASILACLVRRHIRAFEDAEFDELAGRKVLFVGPDRCQWFEWEDQSVDLSRRGPPRRILAGLVEAHAESPGRGLDVHQIVELGWPDEVVQPEAAKSRTYTAIRTLRDLGLRDILLTTDEGYLLDPEVPVFQSDSPR